MKENVIKEKSFKFAILIINLYQILQSKNEFIISKQLLRSGTSIGANIEEALAGCSKKDFINKMCIASKEARETNYWLKLLTESKLVDLNVKIYLDESSSIINILTKIVKSSSN